MAGAGLGSVLLLLAGCGDTEKVREFEPDPVAWGGCVEYLDEPETAIECATLNVPLDHADPGGAEINLAVARLPATAEPRIGVLALNPGGPGGSGIEFLNWFGPYVAETGLLGRFDLVSFDPRGVGASTPVRCGEDLDNEFVILGPDEGLPEVLQAAEEMVEACREQSGNLLAHVGTNAAARDLDLLRRALGEERLTYLGYSYGTRLGAAYAGLYPDQVRAMVLDGPVDPTEHPSRPTRIQADGFESSWTAFARWCADNLDCQLNAHGGADVVLDAVLAAAAVSPLPAGEREVTESEVYLGVLAGRYSPGYWPDMATGLFEVVDNGSAEILQAFGDLMAGRREDGRYDGSVDAMFLIDCADDPERPPPSEVYEANEAIAASLARFNSAFRGSVGCHPLPEAVDPLHMGSADLLVPALVVALEGDPATPPFWAERLALVLEDAVVVWSDAEGHGAYLAHSWCLTGPITDYLIDLVVPLDGWSCDEPDGWP